MFKHRSYQKEYLDEPFIPKDLLYRNLKELEFINKFLGGHSISLKGIAQATTDTNKNYTLMDIGCGGGDSLKAISDWAKQKRRQISLHGVDLKQDCINYAINSCYGNNAIHFHCEDFRKAFSEKRVDIVHAALFCHHFTESEIIDFIKLCVEHKAIFVINDLERNQIAYYSIKWLTGLFSKSLLVKNDAPLSVLRGFKKTEWISILQKAGIKNYQIQNRWAFRHLIIIYPNES